MFESKTVYIIDTMAMIFRNFHRMDKYLLNDQGQDLNSVYGTFDSINLCLKSVCPDYVALVFDPKDGNFRDELSGGDYKSNRQAVDPQLLNQIPMIIELAKAMGFKVFIKEGFEADDVIASLATKFANEGYDVEIESADKDFVQLINKKITLVNTPKDQVFDYKNGHTKFGVPIEFAVDYQALVGDSADNIPGVQKIGANSAAALINDFGSIENIYANLDIILEQKKVGSLSSELLVKRLTARDRATGYDAKASAFKSYELATLRRDVDVSDVNAEDLTITPDLEKICQLTQKDFMYKIRRDITKGKFVWLDSEYVAQHKAQIDELFMKYYLNPNGRTRHLAKVHEKKEPRIKKEPAASKENKTKEVAVSKVEPIRITSADIYNVHLSQPFKNSFSQYDEIVVNTINGLNLSGTDLSQQLSTNGLDFITERTKKDKTIPELDTYTTAELAPQVTVFTKQFEQIKLSQLLEQADVVSICLEQHPETNVPVYLGVLVSSEPKDHTIQVFTPESKIPQDQTIPLYQNQTLIEFKFGAQEYSQCFSTLNQTNAGYQAFIYAFTKYILPVLTTNTKATVLVNKLKALVHQMQLTQDQVDLCHDRIHDLSLVYYTRNSRSKSYELIDLVNHYGSMMIASGKYTKTATDFSEVISSLTKVVKFMPILFSYAQDTVNSELYNQIEKPLWKFLYSMEKAGIRVDLDKLAIVKEQAEQKLQAELDVLYELAGKEFNPKSPKQVAEVLFDDIGLPDHRKRSTAADVLDELRDDHPIIEHILNYRSLSNLYNNHIENYLKLGQLNEEHAIYTTFMQTEAVTGRLSSVNPNLQNVPVRGEFSGSIRACFIPNPNCKLVSLDYSQIELRVSAFLSQDETMIDAFAHNADIHAKTAANIFEVALEDVTSAQRGIAKAINFGLNYGKTSYSLSKELGKSREEASAYIKSYFSTYPKIKDFIDNTKARALAVKYVSTINQRIIPFPQIDSKIRMLAEAEKRNAINYPIQGSASEIMKVAMVNLYQVLRKEMPEVVCHLQIHDELVFSIPHELVDAYVPRIKEVMETCFTKLGKIKLRADVTIGDYWTK